MFLINIFWVLILLPVSCFTPSYSLNEREKIYIASAPRVKTISLNYDKKAIRALRNNGVYTIEIMGGSNTCRSNVEGLKTEAMSTAYTVSQFMNFKEHHQYIDVIFGSRSSQKKPDGNYAECKYIFRMPLDSISKGKLLKSYNNFTSEDEYNRNR